MRRILKRTALSILAGALAFGLFVTYEVQMGNFHEVVPGEFYRAGQPEGDQLERYIREHGIKTVINLRGANVGSPWYDAEVATAKRLGAKHVDFRMKAARELTDEQAFALIELMRNAKKPLLVHCRAGSDRTGLASALYIGAITKGTEDEAEYQLSLRYGHIPLSFTQAGAMRKTYERMEPKLGFGGS